MSSISVLCNSFESNSSIWDAKLMNLSRLEVIPDISVINPPDCIILGNWVFENSTLTDELFAKPLQICKICLLVIQHLCGNLVSSLEFIIDT